MSNKLLFFLLLLGSFLFSLLLLVGPIDQDFYTFYHIGKGVSEGHQMYGDFADNKGPIFYTFFAIIAKIFGSNYPLAIVSASTILDASILFLIFKFLQRDLKYKWPKNLILSLLFTFFSLGLLKSLSIGSVLGGIYSESLGLFFTLASLLANKRSSYISGAFAALAIMTRLTFAIFIPFLVLDLLIQGKNKKMFATQAFRFIFGMFLVIFAIFGYFLINDQLNNFISNVFMQTISFSGGLLKLFITVVFVLLTQTRIAIIFVISFLILIFTIRTEPESKNKLLIITLFFSSLFSSFIGGVGNIFYSHHFLHFSLFTIFSFSQFSLFKRHKPIFFPLFLLTCVFIFTSYYSYGILGNNSFSRFRNNYPRIKEIDSSKFLFIVPYYTQYYLAYNRYSPDKYFQYFYFSSDYFKNSNINIAYHKNMNGNKLRNTTFMFVNRNSYDERIINEYKANFGEHFKLKKVNEYKDLDAIIEIYKSSK